MKEVWIRFMAQVVPQSADALFAVLDQKIREQYTRVHLMISSPGGSVFHGLSLYNYIKGAPIEVDTYNFGSVDSIGVVIFSAGKRRFSVPHARFLMHGVKMNFNGNFALDEKQLDEHLKSLKIDQQNIAKVIADTTQKPTHKVEEDMNNRTTLNPSEAKDYGLIHEIKSELFPVNAEVITIGDQGLQGTPIQQIQFQPGQPFPFPMQFQPVMPQNQSFTKSIDLDFTT